MFLLEKIVSRFLLPLPMVIILLVVGLICLWFTTRKTQHMGRALVTVAGFILIIFSSNFFSDLMLEPFEYRIHPAFFQLEKQKQRIGRYPVQYVVVLGCGHATDPELPVTSNLTGTSLVRLVEGIRLYRYFNGSKLVLAGGSLYENTAEAASMAKVAKDLGIPSEDIIIEDKSRDTRDQARLVKDIVGSSLFVLVTSASHMPRAMALFEKQGLSPFPAPTGHRVRKLRAGNPDNYFPSADNLGKSETAWYEILGTIWARIRGHTDDR